MMKLIDDWKAAWKLASVWVFAAIGMFPDIYNAVAAMGWMSELPTPALWTIRALAVVGIASRIIKQQSLQGGK